MLLLIMDGIWRLADRATALQYVAALSNDVEYLNSRDATIMGSRNGHAPIYMWFTLTRKGYEGMRKDVERCLRNAHLLKVPAVQNAFVLAAALQAQ